jgi:hypothetical protein
MTNLELQELNIKLDNLQKGVREVSKQYHSIQVTLDQIYEDRDLITDLDNGISQVKRLVVGAEKKNETLTKQVIETVQHETVLVKAEVAVNSEAVEKKVRNTIQTVTHAVLNGLHHSLKKDGKKLSFKSRIARLFSFKRNVNFSI